MTQLTLSEGSFDQDHTFVIAHPRRADLPMICSLYRGYDKADDGIYWAMQHGAMLKAAYTDKDREENARLKAMTPLKNGDVVTIDCNRYRVRILGDFSNAAIFDAI